MVGGKMKTRKLLLGLLIMFFVISVHADTYVSGDVGGQEWTIAGSPYILDGICVVNAQDNLYIGPGVVVRGNPDGNIRVFGQIYVDGTAENPILMTENITGQRWCGIYVTGIGSEAHLIHVTVEKSHTNDYRWNGGGLNIHDGILELAYCTFRNNYSEFNAGAIYTYLVDYDIHHCVFHNNSSINDGGVWGSDLGCSGDFHHNLVYNNHSPTEGAFYLYQGDHRIDHITMVNNTSNGGPPEIWGDAQVTNSIIWNTGSYTHLTTGMRSIAYSTITHGFGSHPTISNSDPLFVDMGDNDYRLTAASPCIDAGDPNYPNDVNGTVTDHGAFSYDGEAPSGSFTFVIPELPAIAGETEFIPVLCNYEDDFPVYSIEGSIQLPSGLGAGIEEITIVPGGPLEDWGEDNFVTNLVVDTLYFSAAGALPLAIDGPLFQIEILTPESWGTGEYAVDWIYAICNEGLPVAATRSGIIHVVNPPLGDVSINGEVQAYDASLLLQYLIDDIELSATQTLLGEVSGNGVLGAEDASLILQYVANNIDGFPVNTGYSVPDVGRPLLAELYCSEDTEVLLPVPYGEYEEIISMEVHYSYNREAFDFIDIIEEDTSRQTGLIKQNETGLILYLVTNDAFSSNEPIDVGLSFEILGDLEDDNVISLDKVIYNSFTEYDNIGDYNISSSSVSNPSGDLPTESRIVAVYPNPFNSTNTVNFVLSKNENVQINIYNSLGQKVVTLLDRRMTQGEHEISWETSNISSGVYFMHCTLGESNFVRRLTLLR